MTRRSILFALLCMPLAFASQTQAKQYTFSVQSDEHLEFARTLCLEALKAAGMDATFSAFPIGSESRLTAEMQAGDLNLAFIPPNGDRLRLKKQGILREIGIPLDRGLLGYRICLVTEANKDMLQNVRTAEDLRRFTVGQGFGWGDAAVYRQAGIPVVEASFSSMLDPLRTLAAGRFDVLPLGVTEYQHFLAEYAKQATGLTADTHLLISYPWFRFVWVSATAPDGDALYTALNKGFAIIAANGTFTAVFERFKGHFDPHALKGRTIIDLKSPYGRMDSLDPRFKHLIIPIP